jgi:hypothetical protein
MELTLQPEDAALLKRILHSFLSDLRMEIVDTERWDLRQALHQDEDRIKALLDRLEQLVPTGPSGEAGR